MRLSFLDQKSERDKPAELVRLSLSGRLRAAFPKLHREEGLAARAELDWTLRVGRSAPMSGRVKGFMGLLAILSLVLMCFSSVGSKPAGAALLKAQSGGPAAAGGIIEGRVTFEGPRFQILQSSKTPQTLSCAAFGTLWRMF